MANRKYYVVCRECCDEVHHSKWESDVKVERCISCGSKICPDCGENIPKDRDAGEFPCFCWKQSTAVCTGCWNEAQHCTCED